MSQIDNPILAEARRLGLNVLSLRYSGEPAVARDMVTITLQVAAPANYPADGVSQEQHDGDLRERITNAWLIERLKENCVDIESIDFED